MNYYKDNVETYFNDKAQIYRHQKEYDVLIASKQALQEIKKRDTVTAIVPELHNFEMELIGEHNQVAAGLAYEAATQCGLSEEEIRNALKTFKAVEGRLQKMGTYGTEKKVQVFNDNNATSGDATIAAIDAINETYHKKPILIIGGTDKGLSLDSLEQSIIIGVKKCIFLKGSGTDRMTLAKEYVFETLPECLEKAFEIARDDDIILFSPGFASFSKHFNNEYERNDAFTEALKKYS